MSKVGFITTVPVDPDTNGGADQAAAMVTRVFDDGSYSLRIFGNVPGGVADSIRNHVNLDGSAFDYEAAAAAQAATDKTAADQAAVAAAAAANPAPSAPAPVTPAPVDAGDSGQHAATDAVVADPIS